MNSEEVFFKALKGEQVMSWYDGFKMQLRDFDVNIVTTDNLGIYEDIFYCNKEYFLITDGRIATRQDCIDTIEYSQNFYEDKAFCIGFTFQNTPVAFLSIIEEYPEKETLYIGLFLMNNSFKRKGIGRRIITSLINEAFKYNYKTLKLSVQDNNMSGYSFWESLGFKIIDKTKCEGFYNLSMELTATSHLFNQQEDKL